jgi:hypothetical protein
MSALPPEADMLIVGINVRYVPLADSAIAEQPRFYRERTYAADAV